MREGAARYAWIPSTWILSLWALWWLWRYAAVAELPGYGALAWPSAAGFLVDATLLEGAVALVRWRAGDAAYRDAETRAQADPRGPRWLREALAVALVLAALARAMDGLHAHLAHRHVDAAFWRTLAEQGAGGLWGLRYVLGAALLTGWAARWLLTRELQRAARLRSVVDAEQRKRLVHRDALRAAVFCCVGLWLGTVIGDADSAARALVAPGEWWVVGSLVELLSGG